jgi:hypothetical protein
MILLGLTDDPDLHKHAWIASVDFVVGNDAGYNAASRRNRAGSKDCTRSEKRHRTDPGRVVQLNGRDHESEGRIAPIVISGTEVGSLRDADITSKSYGRKIVDPAPLSDPAVISNYKMPRVLYLHSGPNYHTASNACSKESQ